MDGSEKGRRANQKEVEIRQTIRMGERGTEKNIKVEIDVETKI